MTKEDYFCAEGKPHYIYDTMYYYNSPFFTCKSIKNTFKNGKSAYEIAVENGFQGSVEEWLMSLKGVSPYIGENGNWFIGDIDTNVAACGDSGIAAKDAAERASQSAVVAGNYAAQAIQAQQAIENKIWYGTIEEYNALETINSSTIYIILHE